MCFDAREQQQTQLHSLSLLIKESVEHPSSAMKKRPFNGTQTQTKREKPEKKKRICEHGSACRFIHEYQHSLEFTHDNAPIVGPGASNFHAFSGAGARLGSADAGFDRQQGFDRQGFAVHPGASSSSSGSAFGGGADPIYCDLCSRMVPFGEFDRHIATHESRGDMLKREQESEYEKSVLLDLHKKDEEERLARVAALRVRRKEEQRELERALQASAATAKKLEREQALANLTPEPDSSFAGEVVTIKFTLPGGPKLVRRFRRASSVQEAFDFLRSLEVLEGLRVALRNSVGSLSLSRTEQRSFVEVGLSSSESLIVVVDEVVVDERGAVDVDVEAVVRGDAGGVRGGNGGGNSSDINRKSGSGKGSSNLGSSSSSSGGGSSSSTARNEVIDLT